MWLGVSSCIKNLASTFLNGKMPDELANRKPQKLGYPTIQPDGNAVSYSARQVDRSERKELNRGTGVDNISIGLSSWVIRDATPPHNGAKIQDSDPRISSTTVPHI